MTDSKTVENWLVINWKTGSTRTRKSEPDDLGTYELATRLSIEIDVPDVDVPELAARVQVPQPQVQTAVLESIDDEDLPDWSDAAEEVLAEHRHRINDIDHRGRDNDAIQRDLDDVVDLMTTRTLTTFDGYAEPDRVRDYVNSRAREIWNTDAA